MKNIITFFGATLFIVFTLSSCIDESVSNRDKLIIGKWDCIDYADTVTFVLKGRPPIFISDYYETGYHFKRNNFMRVRNRDGAGEMFTNKKIDCEWIMSQDKLELSLIFPNNSVEKYEILELNRKSMTLKGIEGDWADNGTMFLFEKK